MSINTAEKRRSVAGIPFLIPSVTPSSAKDKEWRREAAWNYPFELAFVEPTPVIALGDVPMTVYFSVSPLEDTVIGDVPMVTYANSVPPQGASAFIENPGFPIIFHDGSNLTFHDASHVVFHNFGTISPDVNHTSSAPRTSFTGSAE